MQEQLCFNFQIVSMFILSQEFPLKTNPCHLNTCCRMKRKKERKASLKRNKKRGNDRTTEAIIGKTGKNFYIFRFNRAKMGTKIYQFLGIFFNFPSGRKSERICLTFSKRFSLLLPKFPLPRYYSYPF